MVIGDQSWTEVGQKSDRGQSTGVVELVEQSKQVDEIDEVNK